MLTQGPLTLAPSQKPATEQAFEAGIAPAGNLRDARLKPHHSETGSLQIRQQSL